MFVSSCLSPQTVMIVHEFCVYYFGDFVPYHILFLLLFLKLDYKLSYFDKKKLLYMYEF